MQLQYKQQKGGDEMRVTIALIISFMMTNMIVFGAMPTNNWKTDRSSADALIYFDNENDYKMPYRLYKPSGYKKNQSYPLIVYLHDVNGKGNDNQLQVSDDCIANELTKKENLLTYPCFILVPQCPVDQNWVNGIIDNSTYSQQLAPASKELTSVMKIINFIQEQYSINDKRIYVGGLGEGATATWDLCTRYPDVFAAAFPMGGRTDPSTASALKNISVWAFHSQGDNEISIVATSNMVNELKKVGTIMNGLIF